MAIRSNRNAVSIRKATIPDLDAILIIAKSSFPPGLRESRRVIKDQIVAIVRAGRSPRIQHPREPEGFLVACVAKAVASYLYTETIVEGRILDPAIHKASGDWDKTHPVAPDSPRVLSLTSGATSAHYRRIGLASKLAVAAINTWRKKHGAEARVIAPVFKPRGEAKYWKLLSKLYHVKSLKRIREYGRDPKTGAVWGGEIIEVRGPRLAPPK